MMFISFIKIFFQNFIRHRLFSLINVSGLGIGLACCVLIALFVQYELSYDRQYANADGIYLVDQVFPDRNDGASAARFSSTLLAGQLQEEYSDMLVAGRYVPSGNPVQLESVTAEAPEARVRFADAGFLRIFDFIWLEGSPQTALRTADEIVLTRELAEKYFGSTDVLGRTMTVDAATVVQVTGVIEKPAGATTLDFSALLPIEFHARIIRNRGMEPNGWYTALYHTFVLLDGADARDAVERSLPAFVERYIPANREGKLMRLDLLPLKGLYLTRGSSVIDNRERVLICVAIAAIILLIAAVNFMNLSTSRASTRSLEVGLRLALGSARGQLVRHFLGEAVLMTTLAMLLALVLAELLLPFVNGLLGLELSLAAIPLTALVPVLLLVTVVVGLLAGFYPAFYLSEAQPARILHGDLTKGRAGIGLRAALVVCQFTLSISLIVAALVMFSQLRFLRELNLGFTADSKVLVALPDKERFDITTQWTSLRQQLLQVPGVSSVSYALDSPLMNFRFASAIRLPGEEPKGLDLVPMAHEYLQQYDIDLVAGRYFNADTSADNVALQDPTNTISPKGAFILNESAVRALGLSAEAAIGEVLSIPMGSRGVLNAAVVGVVENTVSSAFSEAPPTLYYVPEVIDFFFVNGTLTLEVEPASLAAFNAALPQAWKSYFPNAPLQLRYLDDVVQGLYDSEKQQMLAIGYAALVAVLIACVGLLGLAAFNAEQRRKEIGVRKVMGGSVWSIVLLLTNDFSKLVLLSNLIAWPVAYFAMERWLENFAYRIDLTPLIFIGSGLIALCIAWVTVGGTAAKAASAKPVLALRYE
jgi:putative ABC transport system permease protein